MHFISLFPYSVSKLCIYAKLWINTCGLTLQYLAGLSLIIPVYVLELNHYCEIADFTPCISIPFFSSSFHICPCNLSHPNKIKFKGKAKTKSKT